MTRFTSTLTVAAVSLGLIGGFGLTQPVFAATAGGHEATEHSGKDSVDKAGSAEKSSADKGADKSSADKGDRSKETETETSDASDR
jgi:hypothetical protein